MKGFSKKVALLNGRPITTASKREPKLDDSPIDPAPVAPDFAGTWALVYTEPRREEMAVQDLIANGWPAWCPMMTVWVTSKAMVKARAHRPLFPRYIFVGLDTGAKAILAERRIVARRISDEGLGKYEILDLGPVGRASIEGCKGVAGLVGAEEPLPVSPRVIYGLSQRQAADEFDHTRTMADACAHLRIGQTIRIVHGAMEGHSGRIASIGPDGRIRLLMQMLGGEIPVEVGLDQIGQIR